MKKGEAKGRNRERLNNNTKQHYLEKLLDINMDPYDLLQNGRKTQSTTTFHITWHSQLPGLWYQCLTLLPTQCKSSEALSHKKCMNISAAAGSLGARLRIPQTCNVKLWEFSHTWCFRPHSYVGI